MKIEIMKGNDNPVADFFSSPSSTPETDAALYPMYQVDIVWPEFARKLERERDEAKAELKEYRSIAENIGATKAVSDRDKAVAERDEAREQVKELIYISERAIALAEIDFENDKFGIVSELRDGVERIKEGAK